MSIPSMSISFNNNNYPMGQNQSIDVNDKVTIQPSPTEEIFVSPDNTTGETIDQVTQKAEVPDYQYFRREEAGISRRQKYVLKRFSTTYIHLRVLPAIRYSTSCFL